MSHRGEILNQMAQRIPYLHFLGLRFETAGERLTAVLPFSPMLIGNPAIPALHGGVTAAFLETTAIVGLLWTGLPEGEAVALPALPKTIDLTVDYLRPGLSRDSFAEARVVRQGRRYASVHVEAWQDDRSRLFAQGTGHFLMPEGVR
ncbi:PaaI family thioesterase [Xinfangfangia sp. CPCC 101601]|uniref:PaaI family thioesterase n=1 Tax=Pseudogemmobacter lacusdianii TaxID=3069608 RepID=A0ABU0VYJ2_9RHOB|nr:PaaI family thioesterase [Xinfangfangia sp. CPCC 101601]MDQ2066811.1 PaaI family thioesterase [Xinfangfangia sp. CPCC 101601]